MCLIRGCKGNKPHSMEWGLKHKLCSQHYDEIVKRLTNDGKVTFSPDYLSDYVGLKAMMLEMETVMTHMTALSQEIEAAIQAHMKSEDDADDRFRTEKAADLDYIRISRVLENYEGYCWFPPAHRIFVGGLTAADFYWYLRRGYMVKDPGPNIYHGDFTHRYQWHAVMRHLTNGFTSASPSGDWKHTPLELYVSLGSGEAQTAGIWGKVVDRDDTSPPDIVTYATFCNPNTLHDELRLRKLNRLTINTNRRFIKRQTALEAAKSMIERWKKKNAKKWSPWMMAGTDPSGPDLAGLLYAWRKNGGAPIGIETGIPALPPKTSTETSLEFKARQDTWRAKNKLWNAAVILEAEFGQSPNSGICDKFRYKKGAPQYQFIVTPKSSAEFTVLAETLDDDKIEYVSSGEIQTRVTASRGGFDTGHYEYGKTGARKIKSTTLPLQ